MATTSKAAIILKYPGIHIAYACLPLYFPYLHHNAIHIVSGYLKRALFRNINGPVRLMKLLIGYLHGPETAVVRKALFSMGILF